MAAAKGPSLTTHCTSAIHFKLHEDAAQELRKKNVGKRGAAAAKAKATREQNKRELEVEGHSEPGPSGVVAGS